MISTWGIAETGFNSVTGGPPTQSQWRQTFYDEFQGLKIDETKWQISDESCKQIEEKFGEKTPFVLSLRKRPLKEEALETRNVYVKDGFLNVVNRRMSSSCSYPHLQYSGGLLQAATSKTELFLQTYGYFEARIKYANHPRINNAFWLVGNRREVDINEGWAPHLVRTNFHKHIPGVTDPGANVPRHFDYESIDFANSWHVFGLEWNADQLIYYMDGKPIRVLSYTSNTQDDINIPVGTKLGVLLSTAVMNLNDAEFARFEGDPQGEAAFREREYAGLEGTKMVVDWVKVWQKVDAPNTVTTPVTSAGQLPEIEAEDFAIKTIGKGGFKRFSWDMVLEGDDGHAYMTVPPSEKTMSTRDNPVGPELTYFVRFDHPGRYLVNVHMRGYTKNADSIHFGRESKALTLREENGPISFGMQPTIRDGEWHAVSTVAGRKTAEGVNREQVIVDIPYAGLHEFNIWMREPGVSIDKFSFNPLE